MNTLDRAIKLLDEADGYFGPCWCKKSIGYTCPQCKWREEKRNMVDSLKFDVKGNLINLTCDE